MIFDIAMDLNTVDFAPKNEIAEIIQNVRTILTTFKKTVPMDREFGIDGEVIDLPLAVAQARMTAEIVAAVNKYEPRAQVLSVDYAGKDKDETKDGVLTTKVKVNINGIEESA